ncbi:TPA: ead/Ea22-like family protein [Citrobacter koseri]|nr:ead/Ea22-like family protein [Citrobacter koseri]
MSNIDKRALREAAEKATPGRWEYYPGNTSIEYNVDSMDEDQGSIVYVDSGDFTQKQTDLNGEFIASVNPATVLALLDELEVRDKQVAELVTGRLNLQWILNVYAHAYEEAKEQIAKDVEIKARLCRGSNSLFDRLRAAEKRIAELEAKAFNPAILDVIAERQRQQSVEGWTPEHDDEHGNGELAMAAVCYINETGTVNRNGGKPWGWPWDASWWKPTNPRRDLVKAGALILAEIERIDRATGTGEGE